MLHDSVIPYLNVKSFLYVQLICSWLQSEFCEKFGVKNKDLVRDNFHKRVEQMQNKTQKDSWLQRIRKKLS